MDECSKTREDLIEELQGLRREVALLKSTPRTAPAVSDPPSEWPASLVDEMDQFVVLLDSQGQILEANRTMLLGCGLERKDILGVPFAALKCWQVSREVNNRLRRAIPQDKPPACTTPLFKIWPHRKVSVMAAAGATRTGCTSRATGMKTACT
jgi:PAS domain-containing protein